MPWTKEDRKKYNIENKEKIKEQRREYYLKNKEKINKNNKKWKEENKEQNKDTTKSYNKIYRETHKNEISKKDSIIYSWINNHKIKFADRNEAEFYYNSYINTHRCTWCDKMFENSKERCMDHCHTCGLPRAIICKQCNFKDLVPCVNCLL